MPRRSRISEGLLWAAELKATNATRRTFCQVKKYYHSTYIIETSLNSLNVLYSWPSQGLQWWRGSPLCSCVAECLLAGAGPIWCTWAQWPPCYGQTWTPTWGSPGAWEGGSQGQPGSVCPGTRPQRFSSPPLGSQSAGRGHPCIIIKLLQ